jgi:phage gp29-like protein
MPPTESPSPEIVIQPMVAPAPKRSDKLVRAGTTSGRPGQIVSAANRWRENYNPLRHLTMRRVVELLELGQRGDYAYLQWAYKFAEMTNPTLSGLISRCEAPFAGFDWHIKKISTKPPEMDEAQFQDKCQKQKETLEAAYNAIDNLIEAILHMHMADFRGYAHLQKHRTGDGDVYHLECLAQWCICRDGLNGNWWWNPDSRSTSAPLQFLGKDFCIGGDNLPLSDFIIRECHRPIDRIGLVDTVRRGLCEKDWDAFIEIYGIPGGVVTMPSNVPQGKESEYEAAAQTVSEGGTGAIPAGSSYTPNDHPRGVDPFTPRLNHLDEALVLAGTGGKLSMLTERSGAGGQTRGSSRVHDKSFGEIADGRARNIAEQFRKQFDAEVLNKYHEGEPHLVYFDFGAEEEEDLSSLCANVLSLKQAGKNTDTQWLAEKTGYILTDDEDDDPEDNPANPTEDPPPIEAEPDGRNKNPAVTNRVRNRDTQPSIEEITATIRDMLVPLHKRLEAIESAFSSGVSMDSIKVMIEKLLRDFPHIAKVIEADHSLAQKFSPMLQQSLVKGIKEKPQPAKA